MVMVLWCCGVVVVIVVAAAVTCFNDVDVGVLVMVGGGWW